MTIHPAGISVCILCLVLQSCGGGGGGGSASVAESPDVTSTAPPAYTYEPPPSGIDDWAVTHLEEAGFEVVLIESMMTEILGGSYSNIDSITIVRQRALLFDELIRTGPNEGDREAGNSDLSRHNVYSVTKSVTSLLIGIALDQGVVSSTDELVYDQFPQFSSFANWDDRKAMLTIDNLLTMQHGLDWDELSWSYNDSRNSLIQARNSCHDWLKCFLDLPMTADPGTEFAYSTHATLALGAIIENRSGMPLQEFADLNFFTPLGISNYLWGTETPAGRTRAGSGLLMTGRDMAKIGQLMLNLGLWENARIVSEAWITRSVQQRVTLPEDWSSSGYGYQWWLREYPRGDTNLEAFLAVGYGGQYIIVIPDLELVVTFTGSNFGDNDDPFQPHDLMQNYILPSIR